MKISKKYILFDLDGTVTDSKRGILKSMQYALKSFGAEIKDEELDSYSFFLGPPLRDSFNVLKNRFGLPEKDTELAVEKYREYFVPKGMFENDLYPGIETLLKNLKESGKTVILATSKVEAYAKRILEYFNILKYFDITAGSELDGRRSKKSEVILYALAQCRALPDEEKAKSVMVGDRNHDIIGAAQAGIDSIGVLYGYGSREELTGGEYKADYTVKDVGELSDLLI